MMKNIFDLDRQLGVKSYSFRHIKENADVAAAVKQCGATVIDLSGCHVDYDDPAQQERAIESYRQAGIQISGIGVVGLKNDKAFNRRFFEFARKAGCGVVSCSFGPDDHEEILRGLEALCATYGIAVAIHNHGGKDWLGNAVALDYVFRRTGAAVGLCLDTAWSLQAGENPLSWLEKFGDRLHGLHLKDFVFDPKGGYCDTIVGEGALDLPAFLKAFRSVAFSGSAVVEYEGDDAVEATARCIKVIQREWAATV
jgi:sugar phosphate isomerase/epimerase